MEETDGSPSLEDLALSLLSKTVVKNSRAGGNESDEGLKRKLAVVEVSNWSGKHPVGYFHAA